MKTPVPPSVAAILCLLAIPPAYALDTVRRYPTVAQANLNTVCWTGTQFVAAGEFGAVLRSQDGVAWTVLELPGAPVLLSSAAGAGRLAVAGEKMQIFSSADGVNWTPETILEGTSPYAHFNAMAFNGTAFRVAASNASWSSADGKQWTFVDSLSGNTPGIAVQGSEFLMWDQQSQGTPQILRRDAGSGWTGTTTTLTEPMESLVWAGVRYVSVGKSGVAATSTDGTTWTVRTTGVTNNLSQILWTGSLAVAVGAGGTVITSPNGVTWTPQSSGTTVDLTSIAWSGSSMVAVGPGGTIIRSMDGIAWSVVHGGGPRVSANGMAWTGSSAVAVGPEGTLISNNGLSWTKTAATGGPVSQRFRAAAGNGKLVGIDANGLWTAPPDASSWIPAGFVSSIFPVGSNAILWDGMQFVAILHSSNRSATGVDFYGAYSEDGVTWDKVKSIATGYSSTFETSGFINDLLFTGSRYFTSRRSSVDGRTWSSAAVPANPAHLFATREGILAVFPNGGISISPDGGSSWTVSVDSGPDFLGFNQKLDAVVWTGTRLLGTVSAYNLQGIWEGGPGRPWTRIHPEGGTSMAWTGTRAIVATGSSIFTFEDPESTLPLTWPLWRAKYFTEAQLNDPAISGPLADPDGDGHANIVECMTGTSPVFPTVVPLFTIVPPQGGGGRAMQWTQDTGRTDVRVVAEVSNDGDIWDQATAVPVSGPAGGVRLMQASAPPGQPRFFFRLRVTLL